MRTQSTTILCTILSIFCLSGCEIEETMNVELYGIQYGTSEYKTKYVFAESRENDLMPFAWMFYVLKIEGKVILVDTGFRSEQAVKSYAIKNFRDPIEILKEMGISPAQVTDVVITHSHFDHTENMDRFPKARVVIQKHALDQLGKKNLQADKLTTFDSSILLYDILKINHIGGHTIGSSVVSIMHNEKQYLLPGDECYMRENCVDGIPIGDAYNPDINKAFVNTTLSNTQDVIVLPFHDPVVFEEYPQLNDNVVKIFGPRNVE